MQTESAYNVDQECVRRKRWREEWNRMEWFRRAHATSFLCFFFFCAAVVVSFGYLASAYKPTSSLLIWFAILLFCYEAVSTYFATKWKLKSSKAKRYQLQREYASAARTISLVIRKVNAHHVRFFFFSTGKMLSIWTSGVCDADGCFVAGCAWSELRARRHLHKHWIPRNWWKLFCGVRVCL